MPVRRRLALFLGSCLVAIITIAVWAEHDELLNRLRIPPPSTSSAPQTPREILLGDRESWINPGLLIDQPTEKSGKIEPNIVHLATLEEPPIKTVDPKYPELARRARVSGAVELEVVIGKDGSVENLRLLSGHPLLVKAAMDALRQWRWNPFLLNDKPVRVESKVAVQFVLN